MKRSLQSSGRGGSRLGAALVASAAVLSLTSAADAAVKHEGVWPEEDAHVSLDLERVPRDLAIKELAKEARWSVVVHAPAGDPVDVHVEDQPASKVLDLLLMDANYVAKRDGSLIAIVRSDAPSAAAFATVPAVDPGIAAPPAPPAPPEPPAPPAPPAAQAADAPAPAAAPMPSKRGTDRTVTGSSLTIEKGETVHDVSVFGGSLKVLGTVTGDVAVMGGSAKIREGGRIMGDASVFGGSLSVEDGARVDGDVEVLGGSVTKGDKAIIGGSFKGTGHSHESHGDHKGSRGASVNVNADDAESADEDHHESTASSLLSDAGSAISSMAMLFVFGAVLLALMAPRMETVKVEVAARPMRSFALGIVGALGTLVVFVATCVTIVGIPFAVVGLLLAFLAMWGGVCAVLETAGAAVVGHRTKNPYMHLAAGCGMFLVLGAIPYFGGLVTAAVIFTSIGALVATRVGGLIPTKRGGPTNGGSVPYRSSAETVA